MAELTQKRVKELFYYTGEHLIRRIKKAQQHAGKLAGTVNSIGYWVVSIDNKLYLLHRVIYLYCYGYLPKQLDHKDTNIRNNKISNLRKCNYFQNTQNSSISKNNTSGVKGVYWDKQYSKWRARICAFGKTRHLGMFKDLELAELVADEARELYHGEFARNY